MKCPNCEAFNLLHTVCKKCGFYKGKEVLDQSRNNARVAKREEDKARQRTAAQEPAPAPETETAEDNTEDAKTE